MEAMLSDYLVHILYHCHIQYPALNMWPLHWWVARHVTSATDCVSKTFKGNNDIYHCTDKIHTLSVLTEMHYLKKKTQKNNKKKKTNKQKKKKKKNALFKTEVFD